MDFQSHFEKKRKTTHESVKPISDEVKHMSKQIEEQRELKKVKKEPESLSAEETYKKWLDHTQSDPKGYQLHQERLYGYLSYRRGLSKKEIKAVALDLMGQAIAVRHKALEVCPEGVNISDLDKNIRKQQKNCRIHFEHLNFLNEEGRNYNHEKGQRLLTDIHIYQNKVLDLVQFINNQGEEREILDAGLTQFVSQLRDTIEEKGGKWLDRMQSDPQAYQHHQQKLHAYLHHQRYLSSEETRSMAFDLMGQAIAVNNKALQACPKEVDISDFVDHIEEQRKNCRLIFERFGYFKDSNRIYSRKECWQLFKAIHAYQNEVSDLVDFTIKRQNDKGEMPDSVLTQFVSQKKETAQDYLYSQESPPEVRQKVKEIFKFFDIETSKTEIEENQELFNKFLHASREIKSSNMKKLRDRIADTSLFADPDENTRTHALMWWRAIDIELHRRELIGWGREISKQSGTHTRAVIYLDGESRSYILTSTSCSGQSKGIDPFKWQDSKNATLEKQLAMSIADAEGTTLREIQEKLDGLPDKGTYKSISVYILGQLGPCDGCHHRIKDFEKRNCDAGLSDTFTVTSIYQRAPNTIKKNWHHREEIDIHYGRANRAIKFEQKINLSRDPDTHPPHTYYAEEY